MPFNWKCPHCSIIQTVDTNRAHRTTGYLRVGKVFIEDPAYEVNAIGCCNTECGKVTLKIGFGSAQYRIGNNYTGDINHEYHQQVIPNSSSKPQPSYIPKPILEDYEEACLILNLSPKASATLVRRCLQGIIRDFCGISKSTLNGEIQTLREQVESGKGPQGVTIDTIDGIDHVRTIGNIGAHMERDINIIVEVDPDEARVLIELVETLFEEWYINRHRRQERLAKLAEIAAKKDADKLSSNAPNVVGIGAIKM